MPSALRQFRGHSSVTERLPSKQYVGGLIPPVRSTFRPGRLTKDTPPFTRWTGVQIPIGLPNMAGSVSGKPRAFEARFVCSIQTPASIHGGIA